MGFETKSPRTKAAKAQAAGAARGEPRGAAPSGSGQRRSSRSCATWPPRGEGIQGESSQSFCGQRAKKRRARADLRAVLHKLKKSLREDSARDEEVASFFAIERDRLGLEPRGIGLDDGGIRGRTFRWQGGKPCWGEGAPVMEDAGS